MGIFNEISQTPQTQSDAAQKTNFDVVLSKFVSKTLFKKISMNCYRKGKLLNIDGNSRVLRKEEAMTMSEMSNRC